MDGTHVLVPHHHPHQGTELINRKGYFSRVLQGLVDHCGWVVWKGPSCYDLPALFILMEKGIFIPRNVMDINDVAIALVILGEAEVQRLAQPGHCCQGRLLLC